MMKCFSLVLWTAGFLNVTSCTLREVQMCSDDDRGCMRSLSRIFVWCPDSNDFISLSSDLWSQPVMEDALQGVELRVAAIHMPPYVKAHHGSQSVSGFVGDIWKVMEEFLLFKSNLTVVDDFDVGTQLTVEGEVDIFLAAGVANSGYETLEFTQPYFYNWYQLYMKLPSRTPNSTFYIRTMTPSLWYACLATFITLTLTLHFTVRALNSVGEGLYNDSIEHDLSLPTCFLSVVSGFCNQGFDIQVTSYAGRIQLFIALIFGYIVYSSMSAILVSELAVSEIQLPIKSMDDVIDKSKWSLCVRPESFVNSILEDFAMKSSKWRSSLNTRGCKRPGERIVPKELVCRQDVVILESQAIMSSAYRGGEIHCDLLTITGRFYRRGNSIIVNKDFKHRRLIYLYLEKLRGNGILHKLQNQWVRLMKEKEINPPATIEVTLNHVRGILIMYCSTSTMSFLVFIGELLVERYQRPKWQYIE